MRARKLNINAPSHVCSQTNYAIILYILGKGGSSPIAKRLSFAYYNKHMRAQNAKCTGVTEPPKKRIRPTTYDYQINMKHYNVLLSDVDMKSQETLFKSLSNAETMEEKREILSNTRGFVQTRMRDTETRQIFWELAEFWEAPELLDDHFHWVISQEVNLLALLDENDKKPRICFFITS